MDISKEDPKALREEMIRRYGPFKFEAREIDFNNLEVYNVKNSCAGQDSSEFHSYLSRNSKEKNRLRMFRIFIM